jgi:hypothetical protein
MTTMNTQMGLVKESTYGTPVTVTRFFEFNSETMRGQNGRVVSKGLRAGARVARVDRFEPYRIGAAGGVVFDVPTKGFGYLLELMLGTVGTVGPTDANYTHTGTIGTLLGDFFTLQFNRPFHPSGTSQAFTYEGCKIIGWELSCDVDGVLVCTLDVDAEDENTATALATASYPSDFRVFTFAGAAITIAAAAVELKNFSLKCTIPMDTDRRYLRGSSLKKEPVEKDMREFEWRATADFSDLTQYNRVRDASRVNNLAAIVATFDGPVAHGGTTLPRLTITLPGARFDEDSFNISGPNPLMQDLSGLALDATASTGDAVTISYRTTDVTP